MVFWSIVVTLVVAVLAWAWIKDRQRRALRSTPDGFGNHAEQRSLEEDRPVTLHVGPDSTRQGQGSSISYYS